MRNAIVIGATGDVGHGVTKVLLAEGYQVIAVGRTQERLDSLRSEFSSDANLQVVLGSVADMELGKIAAEKALAFGPADVVITSVNIGTVRSSIFDLSPSEITTPLHDNVKMHFSAARSFIPIIKPGGVYLGIGGGMADLIFPGMVASSICQAALRNFYRFLAQEPTCCDIHIRQLILYSMIAGKSRLAQADPLWITDDEVGKHVSVVLSDLKMFEGPILALRSRRQIGSPESKPQ
jgi:NAD(P)-dependent dehydrogenase (short-subunit alcohol dehydrogenase family)